MLFLKLEITGAVEKLMFRYALCLFALKIHIACEFDKLFFHLYLFSFLWFRDSKKQEVNFLKN